MFQHVPPGIDPWSANMCKSRSGRRSEWGTSQAHGSSLEDIPNRTSQMTPLNGRGLTMAPQCTNMCPSSKAMVKGLFETGSGTVDALFVCQQVPTHKSHYVLVDSLGHVTRMQRWCTCLLPSSKPCGAESRWWCSDTPEPPRSRNSPRWIGILNDFDLNIKGRFPRIMSIQNEYTKCCKSINPRGMSQSVVIHA